MLGLGLGGMRDVELDGMFSKCAIRWRSRGRDVWVVVELVDWKREFCEEQHMDSQGVEEMEVRRRHGCEEVTHRL